MIGREGNEQGAGEMGCAGFAVVLLQASDIEGGEVGDQDIRRFLAEAEQAFEGRRRKLDLAVREGGEQCLAEIFTFVLSGFDDQDGKCFLASLVGRQFLLLDDQGE